MNVSDDAYPNARAVVNVEDTSGADLNDLTVQNFTVAVDGKPASVVSAELASSKSLPLDLVLVVDVSGSMAGEAIARAREAAQAFVAGLAPEDRVAILTFADEVRPVVDFTVDRAQAQMAIDALVAQGNTALYEATQAAALKAATSTASRRAIVLLSDGAQDGVAVTVTREQALAAAAGAGVPFFTLGEGTKIDRDYLQQLAGVSNGRYLEAPNPRDLNALYAGVGKLLRSQYVVTFDASAASAAGSAIEIELRSGGAAAKASAAYKPGAGFAPAPPVIEGLRAGESVSSARTITASVGGAAVERVAFLVDGVNVFDTTTSPYEYTFEPARFDDGAHTITIAVHLAGRTTEASVAFSSAKPPAAVTGEGLPLLPIAGGGVALLLLVVLLAAVTRLRTMPGNGQDDGALADRVIPFGKRRESLLPVDEGVGDDPPAPETVGELLGLLISRSGPDVGTEYGVGGTPVSIGSAARCGVRVNDADMGGEEARIWIRKGRLMVHKMTKLTTMVVEGASGGWEILDDGDTFDIGQHKFQFRLIPEPRPERASGDIPNVLRDPEGAPRIVTPQQASGAMPVPEARRSSLSDLMPRAD